MDLSPAEKSVFELQSRYERICNLMNWNMRSRHIGRLLLACPEGEGLSERALARQTQIPRSTLRRKMVPLIDTGQVVKINDINVMTDFGRRLHVAAHREVWRLAAGQQVGLSKELLQTLAGSPSAKPARLQKLADLSFPADIPQEISLRIWH